MIQLSSAKCHCRALKNEKEGSISKHVLFYEGNIVFIMKRSCVDQNCLYYLVYYLVHETICFLQSLKFLFYCCNRNALFHFT